jgi:uncharacterized MnhB-related membrane protein
MITLGLLNAIFLAFIIIVAIAALRVRDLVAAVILFGAFSFCSAVLFAVMGAVDVAFTEAVIGAAISTVFFMAAISRTQRRAKD